MNAAAPAALRVKFSIWSAVGVLVVIMALAIGGLALALRQGALDDGRAQTERFAAGARASINRALLGLDVLLSNVHDLPGLRSAGGAGIDAAQANRFMQVAVRQNLLVRYVALLDGQGRVLASTQQAGQQLTVDLPTGFAAQALVQTVPAMVISEPQVSFASAERVVYMARPVPVADGSRLLVVAQVPLAGLEPVLMQGADIPGLEVTLEHTGGMLLLGVPLAERLPAGAAPLRQSDAWGGRARLSGSHALVVAQPTLYPQLWITASLPEQAALARWRRDMRAVLAAALLFAALLVVTGVLLQSYVLRLQRARRQAARSRAMLNQALGAIVSGFLLLDAQRNVVQWNRRFVELFPWLQSAMRVGMPFHAVLDASAQAYMPDAQPEAHADWVRERLARQERRDAATHELQLPTGRRIQVSERAAPESGLMISYHDVTELRQATAEIAQLAFFDPLTNLPNRRLLLDRLTQAVAQARRERQMGALLFIDLDHFKLLNDTRGHEVGDELLRQVGERLQAAVRGCDTVARLGGDEFVVMLSQLAGEPGRAAEQTRRVGDKLTASLGEPYELDGQVQRSSCSVGVALFGHDDAAGLDAQELLKRADIAMYQVKQRRGNGLCFFDPQMQERINQRAVLEADLQTALERGQFVLHYQPQFAHNGRTVGVEALLRWQHPERGLVAPGAFIAVAEDSGLIVALGQWVLEQACSQLAAWAREPGREDWQVSVNVSVRQFRQENFVAQTVEALQRTGAPVQKLVLELTESLVLEDMQGSIAKMHQLRAKGVRFAIDDFGTGHSSLAYLTQLPLHQLKIDQSFTHQIGRQEAADVIVQTIIAMARTLELEVIAEGVETAAQRDFLAAHGCLLFQGYWFSRPVPVEQLGVPRPA